MEEGMQQLRAARETSNGHGSSFWCAMNGLCFW